MKDFKILLQNACEDYLTNLDHEPTVEDIKEMCHTDISDIIWKALPIATENRKHPKTTEEDPIINGVRRSKAFAILKATASSLMGKTVGECIGCVKMLFRDAETYGFDFKYTTRQGFHDTLEHTEAHLLPIIGYSLRLK